MTMHSVQKKLVTDSKHKILIELANNSKQMPFHPDMSTSPFCYKHTRNCV